MSAPHALPIIDLRDLHERAGHDANLVRDVLSDFQPMLETARREIDTALSATARDELARLAHRVKGACATVGAAAALATAGALELAAEDEPFAELTTRVESLFSMLSHVEQAIVRFLETEAE